MVQKGALSLRFWYSRYAYTPPTKPSSSNTTRMMTARMMMLNCVQETSVSAAVVLSVGLLRLDNRVWVVAAVLRAVIILLLYVEPGMPPAVVVVEVALVMEEENILDVGASVVVVFADIGIRRCAEERTELKALVYTVCTHVCVCVRF